LTVSRLRTHTQASLSRRSGGGPFARYRSSHLINWSTTLCPSPPLTHRELTRGKLKGCSSSAGLSSRLSSIQRGLTGLPSIHGGPDTGTAPACTEEPIALSRSGSIGWRGRHPSHSGGGSSPCPPIGALRMPFVLEGDAPDSPQALQQVLDSPPWR